MAFKFWNAPAPPKLGYALHDYVGAVQESGAAMSTGPALLAEIMRQNRELRAKQEMQASEQGFEAQKQRDYLAGLLAHAQYTQGQEAERQKSEQEFRAKESTKQDDAMLRREKAQEAGQTFREMFRQSAETGRALQSQKAMDERQAAMQSAYMDRLDKQEEGRDKRAQMRSTTDLAQTGLQVFSRALGSGRSGSSRSASAQRYGSELSALDAANLQLKAREQAAKELGDPAGSTSKVDPKVLDERADAIFRRAAGLPPAPKEQVNLDEVKATVQGMAAQGKSEAEIEKYLQSKGYSLDHPLPESAPAQAPAAEAPVAPPAGAPQGPGAPRMSLYDAAREAGPIQLPLPPSPDDPATPDSGPSVLDAPDYFGQKYNMRTWAHRPRGFMPPDEAQGAVWGQVEGLEDLQSSRGAGRQEWETQRADAKIAALYQMVQQYRSKYGELPPDLALGVQSMIPSASSEMPSPHIEDLLPLMGMNLQQLNALSRQAKYKKLSEARRQWEGRSSNPALKSP